MNSTITELKEFLYQYGLDFCDGDGCNDPLTWIGNLFIEGKEPHNGFGSKVRTELEEQFKFKHIEYDMDDDYEHGYSVISVRDQLYKLEVELNSGEGVSSYTDFWAWNPVVASTKEVTSYE